MKSNTDIAELLDEPACEHNKKEKSGCAKPKPGSANIGCVLHLQSAQSEDSSIQIMHPITLLAKQLIAA